MTPSRHTSTVHIHAPPSAVWEALTRVDLMPQWMGDPAMGVTVETTWLVGDPIIVRGFHTVAFENRGTVLAFQPAALLRYSHLSSLSRLPDTVDNHSVLSFSLAPGPGGTTLTLTMDGFPTASISKHLDFYWRGTLGILKRFIEEHWQAGGTITTP